MLKLSPKIRYEIAADCTNWVSQQYKEKAMEMQTRLHAFCASLQKRSLNFKHF